MRIERYITQKHWFHKLCKKTGFLQKVIYLNGKYIRGSIHSYAWSVEILLPFKHYHIYCCDGFPEEMDCPNIATTCSCNTGKKSTIGRCTEHETPCL